MRLCDAGAGQAGERRIRVMSAEKPIPKYIRRSILPLSAEDPQLGEKAHASWADAIVLEFAKKGDRNWQEDLRSRMLPLNL